LRFSLHIPAIRVGDKREDAMYHTPRGDRILLGTERRLFVESLAMILDLLATDGTDEMVFGVVPFDELQQNQKLVVLYDSACGLLRPDAPAPRLTAFIESAVAIVYEFAKDQVKQEIDALVCREGATRWRRMILDAARDQEVSDELPEDTDDDKETWDFLLECLAGCVLWDNDYECEAIMDLPPEKSRHLRDTLGISDDYHTDVPHDPPDDQVSLYLDALVGLTVDAR